MVDTQPEASGCVSTIVLNQGQWYRFRIVLSAVNYMVDTQPEASLGCEMQLLAKDGVWLPDGFREVTYLRTVAGNRIDVAIRCQNPGTSTWNAITAANGGGRRNL